MYLGVQNEKKNRENLHLFTVKYYFVKDLLNSFDMQTAQFHISYFTRLAGNIIDWNALISLFPNFTNK